MASFTLPSVASSNLAQRRLTRALPPISLNVPVSFADDDKPLITPEIAHFPPVCPPAPAPPPVQSRTHVHHPLPTIVLQDLDATDNMKAQPAHPVTARARLNPIYASKRASYTSSRVPAVSPTSLQTSTISKRRMAPSPRQSFAPHRQISYGADVDQRSPPQQRYSQLAQQHHQRALYAQRVANRNAQLNSLDRGIRLLLEEEYREEIKAWMLEKEKHTMSIVSAMDQQPELRWHMRAHLLDFLIEIHFHFRLRPETLYLTLSILDRYVSRRVVYKKHYQLVGCVALWLASKFEDAKERVPSVKDLKELCSNAFEEGAFVQMEGHVLETVDWDLGHPTAESWLRILCTETHLDNMYGYLDEEPFEELRVQHVARFLMEMTLYGRDYVQFVPSVIALGSLTLARYICGKGRRPADESQDTLALIALLDHTLANNVDSVSQTLIKKYSFGYYCKASAVVVSFYLRGGRFPLNNTSPVSRPEVLTPVVISLESMKPAQVPATPVRQTVVPSWNSVGSDASTPGLVRSSSSTSSMDMDSEMGQARSRDDDDLSGDESDEESVIYDGRTERRSDIDSEDSEVDFDMQNSSYGRPHTSSSSASSGSMLTVPSSDDMYHNVTESMPITPTTPMFNLDPFGNAQAASIAPIHVVSHSRKDSKDLSAHCSKDKENIIPPGHAPHSHSHQNAFAPCNSNVSVVGSTMGMEDILVAGEYRPALLAIVP
ncbi:hypothetical protein FRC03_011873 [Tulasnella sp. 419]|nr:hypothetical protein FRC03_011873 [Tulasnella sp. 419]